MTKQTVQVQQQQPLAPQPDLAAAIAELQAHAVTRDPTFKPTNDLRNQTRQAQRQGG